MIFSTVLWQLASLMLIAAIGFLLSKLGFINETVSKGMSNILTKACLPCLLISNMQIPFDVAILGEMGTIAIGFLLVMLVSAALILPLIFIKKCDLSESGVLLICASFPNVVYVGKPLMEALWGEKAMIPITIITLVFNLVVFSIGVLLISMGNQKNKGGIGPLLKRSFINPTIISGLIGILFFVFSVKIPAQLLSPMKMLVSMITPLSMLIIGYSLTQTKLKDLIGDWKVYLVCIVRLIAAPVLIFYLLSIFIQDSVILGTLTVAASLPVGANAGVLAQLYDNNPVFASKCILMSTLLCLVTTPLITTLLLVS